MKKLQQLLGYKTTFNWSNHYADMQIKAEDNRLKDFYLKGTLAPDTPLSQVEFVALDFETTGLDPEKDDIVSIGLVPFNLNRIYLRQARHWYVSPDRPLEEESVVIHGITHSDIIDAPDLKKILDEVLEALAGKIVVVHYRNIERAFFDIALKKRIGEGILFPVVDTLDLEQYILKKKSNPFMNWLKGESSVSIRLGSSRSRYGLPTYSPHHALTDSIATAELFQAQVAYFFAPDTAVSKIWK